MITNVNPRPNPRQISWVDFLKLCKTCSLVADGPDAQNRYRFLLGKTEVLHQVRKLRSGNLGATGWFSRSFGERSEYNGHKLTKAGHVTVIETIDPNSSMNLAAQPCFSYMVGQVLIGEMN